MADGVGASGEAALGDLAVDGKVMLLEEADGPLGVAVDGRLSLPTSTSANALGSPNVGWELSAVADERFADDRALVAANVGVRGGPQQALENITVDDYLTWRAGAAYDVVPRAALSAELVGSYNLKGGQADAALPIEAMLGAHLLSDDVNLRLGAGAGLTSGIGAPNWRVVLGVDFPVKNPDPDTDGDGFSDSIDACPAEPEDFDTVLDDDGCPDAPTPITVQVVDADGKPIEGATFVLPAEGPLEPGSYVVSARADGYRPAELAFEVAPAEAAKTLTVPLELVTGTLTVKVVDEGGAPLEADILLHGKVVAKGSEWTGPSVPGEAVVLARLQGYKITKDTVTVAADAVSEATLVLHPSQADLVGDRIDIRDSVYFDTGKASIQERSHGLLDEVASLLDAHPELQKLRIEGHTDSRGSATSNKTLSQARADAVLAYLVGKGVATERLVAVGYGEEKPLDPRNVAEAWEKNRRVDFFVEERSDGRE